MLFKNGIFIALLAGGVTFISSSCINGSKEKSSADSTASKPQPVAALKATDSVIDSPTIKAANTLTVKDTPAVPVVPVKSLTANFKAEISKPAAAKAINNIAQQQTRTLRQAYANYFPIGAAISPAEDLADPAKVKFLVSQYSSLTPQHSFKPHFIHFKENQYNFGEADKLVAFAQANNMKVRGHCLVWAAWMPKWFFVDKNGNEASRELLLQRLKDHISKVMRRYKGKVYCWDVVNEAMGITQESDKDLLYKIIGPDYVDKCFEFARQADPTAKLFYNDSYNANGDRGRKIYELVKGLVNRGVPIDGMGLQFHMAKQGRTGQSLQKDIDQFSALGLEVQITEMDIAMYNVADTRQAMALKSINGLFTPALQNMQTNVYQDVFSVLRRNKGKVTGVTFWGYSDQPVLKITQKERGKNFSFLFDGNLNPKPSFFKVVDF